MIRFTAHNSKNMPMIKSPLLRINLVMFSTFQFSLKIMKPCGNFHPNLTKQY